MGYDYDKSRRSAWDANQININNRGVKAAPNLGAQLLVIDQESLHAIVTSAVMEAVGNLTDASRRGYMTTADVAEHLRVQPTSVPKLVSRDGLPVALTVGRSYRFRMEEVEAWCDERRTARERRGQ